MFKTIIRKEQNKDFLKILVILVMGSFLQSCGVPTTVINRGDSEVIDRERLIMQGIALDTYYKRLEKMNNLTYPLLTSSINFCGERVTYDIGLKTISLTQIDRRFRKAANEKLLISKEQKVLFTIKNSPSSIAGLKSGDIISEISDSNGKWLNDNIFENNEKKNYSANPVTVKVLRNQENNFENKLLEFTIKPKKICDYGVVLAQNDSLNAFADGNNLYLTTGMLRFVDEDRELQFVLAHELAHNIEGHIDKRVNNSVLGTIIDLAAKGAGIDTRGSFGAMGAQMYSQDFEREADYVGLYILANSNIDSSNIENFWRKLAAENPGSTLNYNSTHPTSSERWANIRATQKEIQYKIENGIALQPQRKEN
tara:strand:- start:776 stop:1879 length:1104 start_codon:yes stop_codon:yes gene_type:complete